MNWVFVLFIGIGIGIIFSASNPETAQSINDMMLPKIESVFEKINDMANRFSTDM